MSLSTRLLLFLQSVLAIILVAFSALLFVAARGYVNRQAAESVERTIATLIASVDIEADSVEWEPSDRNVSLGSGPLGGALYWSITDARGTPVDQSSVQGTQDLIAATKDLTNPATHKGWLFANRLVHPPGATGPLLTRDRTPEEIEKGEYPALSFTAGVKTAPLDSALQTLALALIGISIGLWLAALAAGRWVCRKALEPVTEMAAAARNMAVENTSQQLPPPGARGELEELHASLSGLLERLRAALARERRFTAEASHQLRTPLATILGQVEVLQRRDRALEEYQRVIGVVNRQATQMAGAVESLLFLARSQADAHPPSLEEIDLAEWIPEYIAGLVDQPRHADLVFDALPNERFPVIAHRPLLRELVHNLVDNAIKYSPPGSPVSLRLSRNGDQTTLSVENEGPPIPAADIPHLFEPFYRSPDSQRRGITGAGLGLAVVARIANLFDARVAAVNPEHGGARFDVTFRSPVSREQPASPQLAQVAQH
jgi:signal transduction histidine kinase